ncbi:MAG: DUF2341 domain-containing protein [Bacteroidota bacterium]
MNYKSGKKLTIKILSAFVSLFLLSSGSVYSQVPAAPGTVWSVLPESTSFAAKWNPASEATGYRIDVATDIGFAALLPEYNDLDVGNVTGYSILDLSPGTDYYFRVRAYNINGTGDNSSTAQEVTLPSDDNYTLLYSDDFSGDLSDWTSYNSTWTITDQQLIAFYSLSCGSIICPQGSLILNDTYQPSGDWRADIDVKAIPDQQFPDRIDAMGGFLLWSSSTSKIGINIGKAGDNMQDNQDSIDVWLGYWNGSWYQQSLTTIPLRWQTSLWNTVTVEKNKNNYRLYFNGVYFFQFTDTYLNGAGKIGLHCYGTKNYDNFTIETKHSKFIEDFDGTAFNEARWQVFSDVTAPETGIGIQVNDSLFIFRGETNDNNGNYGIESKFHITGVSEAKCDFWMDEMHNYRDYPAIFITPLGATGYNNEGSAWWFEYADASGTRHSITNLANNYIPGRRYPVRIFTQSGSLFFQLDTGSGWQTLYSTDSFSEYGEIVQITSGDQGRTTVDNVEITYEGFSDDGLIAWYPFNGNPDDESGNGLNGINNGAVLTTDRFGENNKAYLFDGSSSRITLNSFPSSLTDLTITAWFRPANLDESRNYEIFDTWQSIGNIPYRLTLNGSAPKDIYTSYETPSGTPSISYEFDKVNEWHLVTATRENLQSDYKLRLYLDGELVGETTSALTPVDLGLITAQIGSQGNGAGEFFNGALDEIKLYNRALNSSEIEAMMISEAGNLLDTWTDSLYVDLSVATPSDDFQVPVRFNSTLFDYSKAVSDGSDIRFEDREGNKLPYWIEKWNDADSSIVWVKVKNSGTYNMLMRFGNSYAKSESNGDSTFLFFDDFEDGIYTDKWLPSKLAGSTGASFSESGGVMTFTECCQTTAYCSNGPGILFSHDSILIDNEAFTIDATLSQATDNAGYSAIYLNLAKTSMYGDPQIGDDRRYGIASVAYTGDVDDISIIYPGPAYFDFDRGTPVLGALYRFVTIYNGATGSNTKVYNNSEQLVYEVNHSYSYSDSSWFNVYFNVYSPGSTADIVKIYKSHSSEITGNLSNGLVAWYPFNGDTDDESGNNNDGTAYGASLTADIYGSPDAAYLFDGTDDYIDVATGAGNNAIGKPYGSWSYAVSCLITGKPSTGYERTLLANYYSESSASDDQFSVLLQETSAGTIIAFIKTNGTYYAATTSTDLADSRYHDITVVVNGEEGMMYIYADNILEASSTYDNTKDYSVNEPLKIGAHYWESAPTSYFSGTIDEVSIYNRALSEDEISRLFYDEDQPPVIAGLSNNAALIGDPLVINGKNFNPESFNNVVYFGPVISEITSASPYSLEVIVPAGANYAPVTVIDTTKGFSASTTGKFTPLAPAATTGLLFDLPYTTSHTSGASGAYGSARISYADIDGDGLTDIVTNNGDGSSFSVRRNLSTAGNYDFDTELTWATGGTYAYSLSTGDIDGDGKTDVVVPNSAIYLVSVFRNLSTEGSVSFAEKIDLSGYDTPLQAALADFDLDGRPDLIVSQQGASNNISVRRNLSTKGNISFDAAVTFTPGAMPNAIVCADFDSDGLIDIASSNSTDGSISILRNTSTGQGSISFAATTDIVAGDYAQGLDAGDLDGDGMTDLVIVNQTPGYFSAFRNTSTPSSLSFETALTFTTMADPFGISLTDVNGDTYPEVAVCSNTSAAIWIYRNTSSSGAVSLESPKKISSWESGCAGFYDMDNDKASDLIGMSFSSGNIYIFRNNSQSTLSEGLVAYYPFNGNVTDESWNGHDGANYGSTLISDRFTSPDRAYSLDGSSNYINYGQLPVPVNNFSASFWFNPKEFGNSHELLYQTNGENGFNIYLNTDFNINFTVLESSSSSNTISVNLGSSSINEWQHVVAISNSGMIRLFINGVLMSSQTGVLAVNSTADLYSGYDYTVSTYYYYGYLDDFRIYDRILTEAEIDSLYSEGGWPPTTRPDALEASDTTQTSFTANWAASDNADGYYIDVSTDNAFTGILAEYNNKDVSDVLSCPVTGLSSNTYYYYRVRAYNAIGSSSSSDTITVLTLLDPPDVPVSSAATSVTQVGFTTNWTHSARAESYIIEVSDNIDFSSLIYNLDVGYITTWTLISGLAAGTDYYYRVRAYNNGGTSTYSDIITVRTIPPDPIAAPASSIVQNSFTANWSSSTGAESYIIDVATDAGFTSWLYYNLNAGNVTSLSICCTSSNTPYYYRVYAYNSGGISNYSNSIALTTLPDIPSPPVESAATAVTQTSFTANWNASAGATGYQLDISTASDFSSFISGYDSLDVGNNTTGSITGLNTGTEYYYRIRAYNAGGLSASSGTVYVITIPGEPIAYEPGEIYETGFTAVWNAATGASGYRLDVTDNNGYVAGYQDLDIGFTTSYSVSVDMTTSEDYYFQVRAYNTSGISGNSEIIIVRLVKPDPPAAVAPAANYEDHFTARWNTSAASLGYYIDVSLENDFPDFLYENVATGNTTVYDIYGLSANTTYYYRVRAYNTVGTSDNSNVITVTTPVTAPVVAQPDTVAQTWFTPTWNKTVAATGYMIDVATVSDFSSGFILAAQDVGSDTAYYVSGLAPGTPYYYRVRAYNSNGTSYNSGTVEVYTLPDTPGALDGTTVTETYFQANWGSVPGASGYIIDVSLSSDFSTFVPGYENYYPGNVTSCWITGLTGYTQYYYRIRAYNSTGAGDYSNSVEAITLVAAPVTVSPETVSNTWFTAKWNSSRGATGYLVDVSSVSDFSCCFIYQNAYTGDTLFYVSGLSPNSTYYYRVTAYNDDGLSYYSGTVGATTSPDPPVPLPASSVGETYFTANWSSSAGAYAYYLDVSPASDFSSYLSGYESLYTENTNSYYVSGLTGYTAYYYRLRATNFSNISGNSETIAVVTFVSPPVAVDPENLSNDCFRTRWNPSNGATGYILEITTANDFSYYDTYYPTDTLYDVCSMAQSTWYYYRLRAFNGDGTSDYSNTISFFTTINPPEALAAVSLTENSFVASWNFSSGASSYYLDVSGTIDFSTFLDGFNNLDVGNTNAYYVSGLTPDTTYYYRLRAYNTSATSNYSDTITVNTLLVAPVSAAPDTVAQNWVTATWNPNPDAEGYYLDISSTWDFSCCMVYDNAFTNDTSYTAYGLSTGTTYYYRVRAYSSVSGSSLNSGTIQFTTIPDAPVELPATGVSFGWFLANWNSSAGATGYYLDLSESVDFSSYVPGFEHLYLGNTTSAYIDQLKSNTTYYYRIQARNDYGSSGWSGTVSVTTLVAAPVAVTPDNITGTWFVAKWYHSAGTNGYILDISTAYDFSCCFLYENTYLGTDTTFFVPDLSPNSTYYYRVRAYNDLGESNYSNTITANTAPLPPDALEANYINAGAFNANWNSSDGAWGYRLDVSRSNDFSTYVSGFENLDVGGNTSHTVPALASGTEYFYRVRAYNSMATSISSDTIQVITLPAAVQISSVHSCNNLVTLTWNADNSNQEFITYNIYSDTYPDPVTLIASTTTGLRSETSKVISGLTPGATYYFRISSVISPGLEGDFGNQQSVIVKTGHIPEVVVKWDDVLICSNVRDSIQNQSYLWCREGVPLTGSGASEQFYKITSPGNYSVRITDIDGCINFSKTIYVAGRKSLTLFPNPASEEVNVSLYDVPLGRTVISIMNSSGMKVKEIVTEKNMEDLYEKIPVNGLDEGIYFIRIMVDETYEYYSKIIVVK